MYEFIKLLTEILRLPQRLDPTEGRAYKFCYILEEELRKPPVSIIVSFPSIVSEAVAPGKHISGATVQTFGCPGDLPPGVCAPLH
jgi:hypothetical protein